MKNSEYNCLSLRFKTLNKRIIIVFLFDLIFLDFYQTIAGYHSKSNTESIAFIEKVIKLLGKAATNVTRRS